MLKAKLANNLFLVDSLFLADSTINKTIREKYLICEIYTSLYYSNVKEVLIHEK